MAQHPKITTLGLFLIDTFEWRNGDGSVSKRENGIIGGGGVYAIIGARIWMSPEDVGILIDRGNDWPEEIQTELERIGKATWFFRENDRPTSTALNMYTGDHRDFKYLTERTRLEPKDLPPELRSAEWLHFVCSPTRSLVIMSQLGAKSGWDPKICYEPIPDRCTPEELESLKAGLPRFAVFSPNHEEAAAFFGISPAEVEEQGADGIERVAARFFQLGATGAVVIRSGHRGAYVLRRGEERGILVPAYHTDASKVVDVTGAGNSFLGGLMAGMVTYDNDVVKATRLASISASYVIEQFALPKMSVNADGTEVWNGEDPKRRLEKFATRL